MAGRCGCWAWSLDRTLNDVISGQYVFKAYLYLVFIIFSAVLRSIITLYRILFFPKMSWSVIGSCVVSRQYKMSWFVIGSCAVSRQYKMSWFVIRSCVVSRQYKMSWSGSVRRSCVVSRQYKMSWFVIGSCAVSRQYKMSWFVIGSCAAGSTKCLGCYRELCC